MDFEKNLTRPKSIQRLLIDQVEEQSDVCDVTIKVDNWEKRFHRCVLIQSPFFECVFRHEYKETQTGIIEIKLGTPSTVEMSIMFLYGMTPNLTLDIAESLMTLAEYFFIPNLKSICVAWLQAVKANEENCTQLIEISSVFDININECMEFATGRLDVLFENEEFTRIDTDSVNYIFTERGLSYISMDDKLKFLLKWTKVDPMNRLESAKDLVKLLDFRDNSREVLNQVVNDPIFRHITEDKVTVEIGEDEDSRHAVLVMDRNDNGKIFWCLDLTRKKWFKLDTSTFNDCTLYSDVDILGVQNSESTVYFTKVINSENIVVCLELDTFVYTEFPVVQTDGFHAPIKRIDKVTMYGDICIITENTSVRIKSKIRYKEHVRKKNKHVNKIISTFHLGKVVNKRIETKPLFSLLKGSLTKICMNQSSVAFVEDNGKRIILYDINDCNMEIAEESTINAFEDDICCAENGFVIFNSIRCLYLLRREGPAEEKKYQTQLLNFAFCHDKIQDVKLYFLNDRCYRYFLNSDEDKYQFEWTSHDEMLAAENMKNVRWTPLPLPIGASEYLNKTLRRKLFHIHLRKSKLRCDIECPHCDYLNNANRGS